MTNFTDILTLKWMYPDNISRQETFNRFIIFAIAVLFVLVGSLTIAFIVQRQEIIDRRERADANTKRWKEAMMQYEQSKQGKRNDQKTGAGVVEASKRHDESSPAIKNGPTGGKR